MDQELLAALRDFDALPDCAFVKGRVVRSLYGGITAKGLHDLINAGELPRPVKIGVRLNGWQVGALRQRLAELAAEQVAA